jgi:hypothetical protein
MSWYFPSNIQVELPREITFLKYEELWLTVSILESNVFTTTRSPEINSTPIEDGSSSHATKNAIEIKKSRIKAKLFFNELLRYISAIINS